MTKNYNEDYVREAAYYNWQNAGCPYGQDEYFWTMAMNQLYGSNACKKSCACKKTSTRSCATKTSTARKTSSKTSTKASSKK